MARSPAALAGDVDQLSAVSASVWGLGDPPPVWAVVGVLDDEGVDMQAAPGNVDERGCARAVAFRRETDTLQAALAALHIEPQPDSAQ